MTRFLAHAIPHTQQRRTARPVLRAAIVGLLTVAGTLTLGAGPRAANAAHASAISPSMTATVQGRMLQVTVSHLAPAAPVTLALINLDDWSIAWRSQTHAAPAIILCSSPTLDTGCMMRNPLAGTVSDYVRLPTLTGLHHLVLLFQAGGHVGFRQITTAAAPATTTPRPPANRCASVGSWCMDPGRRA